MSPQTRATPVRGSSLLLIPWPSAHRSSPRWPLGPCATTEDPLPTSHLPQQTTSHLPCSSLIPPYAVLHRQSVDSGLEQQLLTTPLSEVLYLIQGAYPTSTLSDYSTPSGVPLSLTINTPVRALTKTAT